MKRNFRRTAAERDFPRILQAGPLVAGAIESHGAARGARYHRRGVVAIVERVGNWSGPVLRAFAAVFAAFRHGPDFVAAIVVPVGLGAGSERREIFSFQLWILEEVGVAREFDLHQSSAKLGDQDKLHPMV